MKNGIHIDNHQAGEVVRTEHHFTNDQLHNDNGPAVIQYREDGSIIMESWYVDNQRHNDNGPAVIYYTATQSVHSASWYINDVLTLCIN